TLRPVPTAALSPYTTLFRSCVRDPAGRSPRTVRMVRRLQYSSRHQPWRADPSGACAAPGLRSTGVRVQALRPGSTPTGIYDTPELRPLAFGQKIPAFL